MQMIFLFFLSKYNLDRQINFYLVNSLRDLKFISSSYSDYFTSAYVITYTNHISDHSSERVSDVRSY